jgi:hypothetical protein
MPKIAISASAGDLDEVTFKIAKSDFPDWRAWLPSVDSARRVENPSSFRTDASTPEEGVSRRVLLSFTNLKCHMSEERFGCSISRNRDPACSE